ncbi:DUF551 domain-containing protein [Acinetobacter baumannii]|nr:DUF551 domain-containing protein [Acinetobacter baumannii]EKU7977233.1 DUF551 domain-containing protein [Acinetobacter baumannii]MCT9241677.1 DUF551 domain-containing protein [Acinetobacter baumannii]CAI3129100.1 hypothetical protein MWMV4_MWMV4_00965 [Acinetobacter baumannii]
MTDLNNPETIEIHGLRTITKLCHFGADNNMEGCTFTEIVERLIAELEKAKAQAVPTWISVKDEEPPADTMVLICWSDAPDVQPESDYMTCDEDLNHIWANFYRDPPTHWMHFHKVPSESGANQ